MEELQVAMIKLVKLVGRVFTYGPGHLGLISGRVIPKTLKMVLATSLLNTQQYKVLSRVKWNNPGKGVAPSPTPRCSSYWKRSLLAAFDYGCQLYLLLDRQQRAEELQFEHQKQLSERQQHTEELLAQILKNNAHTHNDTAFSQDSIWNAIDNFHYEYEEDKSLAAYYRRYEDFFRIDWSDQKKTHLLRKLEKTEQNKFVDFILPQKTLELSFDETAKLQTKLFSPKTSLFHKRWKCLNLTKITKMILQLTQV